ncbi:hypothetical protein BDK51DRAFT_47234 [Blyttiomyces helicus]|uniref:Uncharacterized protein n=1 Tax=Blyttiomyces helicus TaxID=388810 RepID=A0A4P9W5Z4_9FUNG|nr:hypothetical protein BDK51DRAFT_47234 [Blyttiomyces helicus]|eukprot:RKO86170.1 hypothetical protein BDK51DRAFT_47234 [Blyttiomyces helicus]
MTDELQQMKSIQTFISDLSKNATASLMDHPDTLYDIAAARNRRSTYIGAASMYIVWKEDIVIATTGAPGSYCYHELNGDRTCEYYYNGGLNFTDNRVNLVTGPSSNFSASQGPNSDTFPIGDYYRWDPSGVVWLDIGFRGFLNIYSMSGNSLSSRDFTYLRYNFSVLSPAAPRAGPTTGIGLEGILQTSALVSYLSVRELTAPCKRLWVVVTRRARVPKRWAANVPDIFTTSVYDAATNTSTLTAAMALNCTNKIVQITAQYLLSTYGSFDVPQDTNLRIDSSDGYILANTRLIDDGRGLRILLVVTLPESDYLSAITQTEKKVIGVAVGVAVAMLVLGVALSYLVTLPLRKFASIMQQTGYMDNRSFVMEISHMQDVFGCVHPPPPPRFCFLPTLSIPGRRNYPGYLHPGPPAKLTSYFRTMLRKFADAIQANKNLVSKTGTSSAGQSKAGTVNHTSRPGVRDQP